MVDIETLVSRQIESRVMDIIHVQLGEKPELDSHIVDDLGADSLDIVELVMKLEIEFELTIPEEEEANFTTPRHIIRYLELERK